MGFTLVDAEINWSSVIMPLEAGAEIDLEALGVTALSIRADARASAGSALRTSWRIPDAKYVGDLNQIQNYRLRC
jgi:hypothetical protein